MGCALRKQHVETVTSKTTVNVFFCCSKCILFSLCRAFKCVCLSSSSPHTSDRWEEACCFSSRRESVTAVSMKACQVFTQALSPSIAPPAPQPLPHFCTLSLPCPSLTGASNKVFQQVALCSDLSPHSVLHYCSPRNNVMVVVSFHDQVKVVTLSWHLTKMYECFEFRETSSRSTGS